MAEEYLEWAALGVGLVTHIQPQPCSKSCEEFLGKAKEVLYTTESHI